MHSGRINATRCPILFHIYVFACVVVFLLYAVLETFSGINSNFVETNCPQICSSAWHSFYPLFKHLCQIFVLPACFVTICFSFFMHIHSSLLSLSLSWWPSGSGTMIYGMWLLAVNGMFYSVVGGSRCLFCCSPEPHTTTYDKLTHTHTHTIWKDDLPWHFLLHPDRSIRLGDTSTLTEMNWMTSD